MRRFIIGLGVAAFFSLSGISAAQEGAVKLADGVYGIKGPGESINTAFVVGERGVFVYSCDLNDYDRRSKLIREASGGKPIRFVANGHYAFDDVGCNHMFAEQGATILGTPALAKELRPYWPERRAAELKQGRIKKEYLEGKNPDMAMPVVLFNDKMTLDLGSHSIELIYMGKAHTPDNTIAWLPKEKILFVDDLLFVELHPTADERSDERDEDHGVPAVSALDGLGRRDRSSDRVLERAADIHGDDPGMGVRASEVGGMGHAREREVVDEAAAADKKSGVLGTLNCLSYPFFFRVAHSGIPPRPGAIASAAALTARTIFT